MSITIESGGWERASGPFWHAKEPVLHTDEDYELVDRGGRPQLVAVYNPAKKDYRVKIFMTGGEKIFSVHPSVDGRVVTATPPGQVAQGLYQARVDSAVLWRILQGLDPVEDKSPEDEPTRAAEDDFLDVNVEATFDTGSLNRYLHPGTIERAPEWMGITAIGVTPEKTGGGIHCIDLRTGVPPDAVPSCVRVNGFWFSVGPVVEGYGNESGYRGRLQLTALPEDIEAAREWEPIGEPDPGVRAMPIGSLHDLKKLHVAVGLSHREYHDWGQAVRTLRNSIVGLCYAKGQIDVHAYLSHRRKREITRLNIYIDRRYSRRPASQLQLSREKFIALGGMPQEWSRRIKVCEAAAKNADQIISHGSENIHRLRQNYQRALDTIRPLAEKYADAIKYLHPSR